ncbi:Zinc finger NHR/GATA-type, partial [Penicillium atrosanguineum]
ISFTCTYRSHQPKPYEVRTTPTLLLRISCHTCKTGFRLATRITMGDREGVDKKSPRQFLPSIHEALGDDNLLLHPAPASASSRQSAFTAPPPHLAAGSSAQDLHMPPNFFSKGTARGSQLPISQLQTEPPRAVLASINTNGLRKPSLDPPSPWNLRTKSSQAVTTVVSVLPKGGRYEYSEQASAGDVTSTNGLGQFPPTSYSFQPQKRSNPYTSAPFGFRLHQTVSRGEEVKAEFVGYPTSELPSSDKVKRQLDQCDAVTLFKEIAETSTRILDITENHCTRTHQAQRFESALRPSPSLNEVENMLCLQRLNHDAFVRIRKLVLNHEQALAEQMAEHKAFKPGDDKHISFYQEEFKGGGDLAGSNPTKQRRKTVPPGRCHRCKRTETPEWRRGPDGARTLCNACGLHYAKVMRKQQDPASGSS